MLFCGSASAATAAFPGSRNTSVVFGCVRQSCGALGCDLVPGFAPCLGVGASAKFLQQELSPWHHVSLDRIDRGNESI